MAHGLERCGGHARCDDEGARANSCKSRNFCIRGNPPEGGCVMGCTGWTGVCHPVNDGLACECAAGVNSGSMFTLTDPCHSEEWIQNVRAACGPPLSCAESAY